jgi:hypothetical protein
MFHIYKEGTEVKNGFNFYSLFDKSSFGVKIRYGKKLPNGLRNSLISIRYAKKFKNWYFTKRKISLDEYNNRVEFEKYFRTGI